MARLLMNARAVKRVLNSPHRHNSLRAKQLPFARPAWDLLSTGEKKCPATRASWAGSGEGACNFANSNKTPKQESRPHPQTHPCHNTTLTHAAKAFTPGPKGHDHPGLLLFAIFAFFAVKL
jgi:hypothetical protein